jgi:hypothetical protein
MEYYILIMYLLGAGMQIKEKKFNWLLYLLSPIIIPVFIGSVINEIADYINKKNET